uniref:Uncharacterized protein n=1 Tax=Oryza brachyantha TaxID=4533 RepID=J3M026_ORYBR
LITFLCSFLCASREATKRPGTDKTLHQQMASVNPGLQIGWDLGITSGHQKWVISGAIDRPRSD